MTFSDRARHDSKIDQLYGDEASLVRDYVLMKVEHTAEPYKDGLRFNLEVAELLGNKAAGEILDRGIPAHTDFYAFHSGDDAEVPSCVPIGETLCDYDESRATEVGRIDGLAPGEVEAAFLAMVEKLVGDKP